MTLSTTSISPEYYAEFLQEMGHCVRQSGGLYWFNTQRGVYTPFPFHRSISSSRISHREVLQKDGVLLRYGCLAGEGIPSFRMLCTDKNYDFPVLRSRTRTQVRRGLDACQVEQVDFDLLQRHAISLNSDTLIRQGRKVPDNLEAHWRKFYRAAERTKGTEAWGAFVDGDLAAYLVSFRIEKVANITIVRSATPFLKNYPNNALLFRFLQQRLGDQTVDCVSYGYESIQAGTDSLDQFKSGMGFERAPVDQRVEFAPWARPLLNRVTLPAIARLFQLSGNPEQIAKIQGIVDWHRLQPARPALPPESVRAA